MIGKIYHNSSSVYCEHREGAVPLVVPFLLWPVGLHVLQADQDHVALPEEGAFVSAYICIVFVPLLSDTSEGLELGEDALEPVGDGVSAEVLLLAWAYRG